MKRLLQVLLAFILLVSYPLGLSGSVAAQEQEDSFQVRIVDLTISDAGDGWSDVQIDVALENITDEWRPLDWIADRAVIATDEDFDYECDRSLNIGRYYYRRLIPPGFRVARAETPNMLGDASELWISCRVASATTNWKLWVEDQAGWQLVARDLQHYQPEGIDFPADDGQLQALDAFETPVEVSTSVVSLSNLRWAAGTLKFDYELTNTSIGAEDSVSIAYYFLDTNGNLIAPQTQQAITVGPGQTTQGDFVLGFAPDGGLTMSLCLILGGTASVAVRVPRSTAVTASASTLTSGDVSIQYTIPAGWEASGDLSYFGELFEVAAVTAVVYQDAEDVVDVYDDWDYMAPANGTIFELILLDPPNVALLASHIDEVLAQWEIDHSPSASSRTAFFDNWLALWTLRHPDSNPQVSERNLGGFPLLVGIGAFSILPRIGWVTALSRVDLSNGYVLLIQGYSLNPGVFSTGAHPWNRFLGGVVISGDVPPVLDGPPAEEASPVPEDASGGSDAPGDTPVESTPVADADPSDEVAELSGCPAAPSRLSVGALAVANANLRVRQGAGTAHPEVRSLRAGSVVSVTGGPACADDARWWQVSTDNWTGWVVEIIDPYNTYLLLPDGTPLGANANRWDESMGAGGSCPGAITSRLQIGQRARVTFTDGSPTSLRRDPGGSVLRSMPEGYEFLVVGGPVCLNNLRWWQLRTDDDQVGWSAEGGNGSYWIEPLGENTGAG